MLLDDAVGYIEKNDGIKYPREKRNKEALKNYAKLWEENKREIEVINDDESI